MKKKKTDSISPIFSLLDSFKLDPESIYEVVDLGLAAMSVRHLLIFLRYPHGTLLNVDIDSRIEISKYMTLYEFINQGGLIYGYFFVVKDSDDLSITDKTLFYGDSSCVDDFTLFPYTNEKNHVFVYKDKRDNILVNISNISNVKYMVLDV